MDRWMKSITEATGDSDIVVDKETGVFGHKVTMLDFNPQEIARFRAIGKIVEFEDVPGVSYIKQDNLVHCEHIHQKH
ncbi:MAG: hypothetical protein PUP92_28830 [Rhizonema sp. PD38]|nr:hypothetical protein [Rhizonema sp. PD38]